MINKGCRNWAGKGSSFPTVCSIGGEKDVLKFKDYMPFIIKFLSNVFEDEIERFAEIYGDEIHASIIENTQELNNTMLNKLMTG
jgi:hypothetical protein